MNDNDPDIPATDAKTANLDATGPTAPVSKAEALAAIPFWLAQLERSVDRICRGLGSGHDQRVLRQGPLVVQRLLNFAELGDPERWRQEHQSVANAAHEALVHSLTQQPYNDEFARAHAGQLEPLVKRMRADLEALQRNETPSSSE